MNTNHNFNWPQRKIICQTQFDLCKQLPTQTIVEGMPIESYWEKELEIAHVQCATNEDILKELEGEQQKHTSAVANQLIVNRYGDGRYKLFNDWLTDQE